MHFDLFYEQPNGVLPFFESELVPQVVKFREGVTDFLERQGLSRRSRICKVRSVIRDRQMALILLQFRQPLLDGGESLARGRQPIHQCRTVAFRS